MNDLELHAIHVSVYADLMIQSTRAQDTGIPIRFWNRRKTSSRSNSFDIEALAVFLQHFVQRNQRLAFRERAVSELDQATRLALTFSSRLYKELVLLQVALLIVKDSLHKSCWPVC